MAKPTTMAEIMVAVYSTKVPSFSDIPSCKVLAVVVMVPAAAPGAIESRTWIVWAKRQRR